MKEDLQKPLIPLSLRKNFKSKLAFLINYYSPSKCYFFFIFRHLIIIITNRHHHHNNNHNYYEYKIRTKHNSQSKLIRNKNEVKEKTKEGKEFDLNIARCFLNFMYKLIGDYQNFFDKKTNEFDSELFLESRPDNYQPVCLFFLSGCHHISSFPSSKSLILMR